MKLHKLYYLCLSLSILCCIAFSGAAAKEDEVSALLSIKASLIDPLDALRDWKAPVDGQGLPHCNWTGVRCNPAGSVDSLDLSRMNISGELSDGINHLPNLAYLNLCCNSFTSCLPESLPNLPLLKVFDVSANLFGGQFPAGLGLSAGLRTVNASGNNFSGNLPEDIANATSLDSLDLRGSFFQGSIPASYKNLKKLKFLGLSGNNLTGKLPIELGQLSSLETLIIGYNEFEGPIPPELGNLTNLQYLDMAIGNIGGPIPAELGKLKLLNTMFLYRNNLEGEIPKELGNLSSLAFLDLSDNQISGTIPAELAQLSNLQLLNLMGNKLTGPIPSGLGGLTHLEILELWNNSLTGPLPSGLGKNSPLQWLDVSSNHLSGQIPTGLCNGGNLTKLILFNNEFSGPIPSDLATSCASLVRVRMHDNHLNGTIPSGLGKLPRIQRLELASNVLTGEIPDDVSTSVSLSFIDLSYNKLKSPLPSNIFSIPSLQTFMASNNELTGEVPNQFQDSPSLAVLDLSSNRLTGNIPASLASCGKLVNLDLSNNSFGGEILGALATMPALAVLDLSNNQLTGSIPSNFGNSPALESVNVSYNRLSGQVPANGVLRTINLYDLAGNPGLCGVVLPPCSGESMPESVARQRRLRLEHIVGGWAVGISSVLFVGVLLFASRWAYRKWYLDGWCCHDRFNQETGEWPWRLTAYQRLNFTTSEVLACIKESNVIGMGAAGIVYKAEMARGIVAVKKLWRPTRDAECAAAENNHHHHHNDIVGEVNLLGRLRHRNIVRLLGSLHNDADTMIVYEYMPNGNLWEALHGEKAAARMLVDWVSRYNVAAGIAQGLAYLHHDCHPQIIHRDVKSNNILLDGNLEARIADFGLARMMVRKNETVSMVAGSHGYIAPEYGYTLKVDQKSDIYSFGVVLMELLTGRKPVEPEFGEFQNIVGWVREKLRRNGGGVEEVLDPSVGGQCKHVQEEMMLVLRIAVVCTAKLPKDRPSMRDVLTMLGEAKPRRKSSSTSAASTASASMAAAARERPVFSTSPISACV